MHISAADTVGGNKGKAGTVVNQTCTFVNGKSLNYNYNNISFKEIEFLPQTWWCQPLIFDSNYKN